jgi:hypothetical protein
MNPRDPEPAPPPDKRILNPIRLTDDTTSDDFPEIASNLQRSHRGLVRLAKLQRPARRQAVAEPDHVGHMDVGARRHRRCLASKLTFDGQGRLWIVWSQQQARAASGSRGRDSGTASRTFSSPLYDGKAWLNEIKISDSPVHAQDREGRDQLRRSHAPEGAELLLHPRGAAEPDRGPELTDRGQRETGRLYPCCLYFSSNSVSRATISGFSL